MILLQDEILLMVGVIGIYIFDSSLLLYVNEGIVSPKRRGDWDVSFGSGRFRIAGKEIFVPNPVTPHLPLYRLQWHILESESVADGAWGERQSMFAPLAPPIWGMMLALFIFLPLGLFSKYGEPMLLAAILLLYACIVSALILVGARRTKFGLTNRRFFALAFESLICSPLALNITRKISRELAIADDLVIAMRRMQSAEQWSVSRTGILARVDEEMEAEDDGSERMNLLKHYRDSLVAGSS